MEKKLSATVDDTLEYLQNSLGLEEYTKSEKTAIFTSIAIDCLFGICENMSDESNKPEDILKEICQIVLESIKNNDESGE